MLSITELRARYGQHRALDGVSLAVERDEIVVILGANGAGKSTLLKAIAGLCEGEVSGSVRLDEAEILGLPAERMVALGIAFVPERRGVFSDLSVAENLDLGAWTPRAAREREHNLVLVSRLFPRLSERRRQRVSTMSGGEQQMVAIGRALMSSPRLLMLDEPSLGLSPLLCRELFRNLSRVRDAGTSVLLVEQNARQSLAIADRAYLLETGVVTGEGAAADLLDDPAVQSAYLGGAGASVVPRTVSSDMQQQQGRTAAARAPLLAASTRTTESTDPVAQLDIAAMLGRATEAARLRPRAGSPAASTLRTASSRRATAGATAASLAALPTSQPQGSTTPLPASTMPTEDADVAALLADMERAAQGARRNPASSSSAAPAHRAHEDNDLPTIPVYRKRAVEVYRRGTDGNLKRQEPTR